MQTINFNKIKGELLKKLNNEAQIHPNNETLKSLYRVLKSYQSASEVNGTLSKIVVDSLEYDFAIGEELISFEKYFSNNCQLDTVDWVER